MKREIIPVARIARSIHLLRGQKVMLSQDLAALYGVAVKALNQAVKRHGARFPADFMFQLTSEEFDNLKSQFVTSSWGGLRRARPYAFTEQGVAMLSSVLNSERAGERTRLACWRWRPRHRELVPKRHIGVGNSSSRNGFSARRRKHHARGVCSPIQSKR
jgi:hypothetical protein